MKKRKASVKDVASAAGVSVATVSRAFNMPDKVRDAVRIKIMATAEQLGYSPNAAAQAFRRQKSFTIGAVIPSLNYSIFAKLVESFQETLSAAGYNVLVLTTGFDNQKIHEPVKKLIDRGIDALMVVGQVFDSELRDYILFKQIPCVTTYSYTDDPDIPSIGFDNYDSARKVVEFLIKMGHTKLVMFAGPSQGNDRQQGRIRAFNDTIAAMDGSVEGRVVEKGYFDAARQGAETMHFIRTQFPEATAVICNSDVFAFAIIAECHKLGIQVPDQLSVTGFDDDSYTSIFTPALTTLAVPAADLGKHAAKELLSALSAKRAITSSRFETHLIVRDSTNKPRDSALFD